MKTQIHEYRRSEPRDVGDIIAEVISGILQKESIEDDAEQRHDDRDIES